MSFAKNLFPSWLSLRQKTSADASQPDPAVTPRRSRLHLVYFVLAAFDIVTICVTLTVTHSITNDYESAVHTSGNWANRVRSITELELLAQRTDAPGNNVFDTRAVARERALRDVALENFNTKWEQISNELERNVSLEERAPIMADLAAVRILMNTVATESEEIFSDFARGAAPRAARRMASMDRTYGTLVVRIADTINNVEEIQLVHLQKEVETAQAVRQLEIVIGGLVFLIVFAVAVYGHKIGQTIRASEARNLELVASLREERTRLEHYADNVSHELRGPIGVMRINSELALTRKRSAEDIEDTLCSTIEGCDRLSSIADGLLFLARVTNTGAKLSLQQIDVRQQLSSLCDYYEATALTADVSLQFEQTQDIRARVDRTLFQRMIGNLISNALAHTPAHGSVVERAREADHTLIVEIEDTGEGISEVAQAHVFERFFRGQLEDPTESGRLGLGLPIAKSIADLHGGKISLSSVVGRGTLVTVVLPLQPVQPGKRALAHA